MVRLPGLFCQAWDRGACCAPVLLVALLSLGLAATGARAQELAAITANQAWDLEQQGGLLIVDVRTQGEWRQTGTAPDAARISLYSNWGVPNFDFAERVLAALGGDRNRPVAVICATGGRSSFAAQMLRDEGFTHVADIAEGMLGSETGVGWLSRALPVEDCGECSPF